MFKKLRAYFHVLHQRYHHIECDINPYRKLLDQINNIPPANLTDLGLQEMSLDLKTRAGQGIPLEDLLPEAFALVREAAERVLSIRAYDTQLMAGIALHQGNIIEMRTGEGKTLSAVFPAYLNALSGQGVHILTYNDYLAQRDAEWMAPVYHLLGLSVNYIKEGMNIDERKQAYKADITYVTAKEAGFDYLRDSLCFEQEKQVHRLFSYAIIDEADSILIDEARIPLVIAGTISQEQVNLQEYAQIAKQLRAHQDYKLDQNSTNIYLTDEGLQKAEKLLHLGDLYQSYNLEALARVNCALYAEVLLKKDKDYIINGKKIELIDHFTGRIAENRHWPEGIQQAVEAKEHVESGGNGRIHGSIALQHYLSLYPKLAGMTGTASTSAWEFHEFYGKEVVVIPTYKPCIRQDHNPLIFTTKSAKYHALVTEVAKAHQTGQPVLVGTGCIRESEEIALRLQKAGLSCRVLNAKNDSLEAEIIAQAGAPGAVTVATNMAGRGVDIKLGGKNEEEKEKVITVGGLYIIGTTLHESRRIDSQLRGRAGRQGDPGECRFLISLEDEFVLNYELNKLISLKDYPRNISRPIQDQKAVNALLNGQRIVEGYHGDLRRQLWKYSSIIEQQRRLIYSRRFKIIRDEEILSLLRTKAPEKFYLLLKELSPAVLYSVEKQLTLYYLNFCWAEYLDYINYIQETIQLVVYGQKNPLDEFNRYAIEAFNEMFKQMNERIVKAFCAAEITPKGIDLDKEGLTMPSSTWTYLINERPTQFSGLRKQRSLTSVK